MDKNTAKKKIKVLIQRYEKIIADDKIKDYSEEETKKDFILPLFEALGWNVYDKYEVSAEEKILSSGWVDYGFYLSNNPKFYLEAKKISVDLNNEEFARQAIKYSFNKGITWAVLTDFEDLKIFNAQSPSKFLGDKLYFSINYTDYLNRFDKLWELSKEAFQEDLIDKKAEEAGKKLQKVLITELLYKDLNECRKILSDHLHLWNPQVLRDLLDEGVQKLLDRLIFIRVLEDRKIEQNILQPLINQWRSLNQAEKPELYESMAHKFRELDSNYNSDIFTPHPFEKWEDEGSALELVIKKLHGKEGYYEYDFSIMSADILGSVYENYLGYKLSQSKKGLTLDKSAVKRKEQGIYYTPTFIVNYIVRNSFKPVLDRCKSVNDLSKIKVLDPACGSGSFLIKALEVILEKYKEFNYKDDENLRIKIIKENLYGVDLDEQAVEIARLSLLINTVKQKGKLPSLNENIKNGNSLLSGSEVELQKYFGKNYRDKKPFNWQEEFPEVFKQGGFDVLIGNPPYIKEDTNKEAFDGFHANPYYQGKMDIWTMFGCIGIDLLKNNGLLGFIAPSNWVTNYGASIFRNKVLNDGEIKNYVDFGDYRVFEGASIQTMILIYQKRKPREKYFFEYLKIENRGIVYGDLVKELYSKGSAVHIDIKPAEFHNKFLSFNESDKENVLKKIQLSSNYALAPKDIGNGIDVLQDFVAERHLPVLNDNTVSKGDGIFVISDNEIEKIKPTEQEKTYLKPYFTTSQINRYLSLSTTHKRIIYAETYFREHINLFPNLKNHIDRFRKILTSAFAPYGLHRTREKRFFEGEGIFTIRKTIKPAFSYVNFPCYVTRAFMILKPQKVNLKYLTAILNSSVVFFWLKNKGKLQGEQLQIDKEPLLSIPICIGNEKQQKQVIVLVDKLLKLNCLIQEAAENSNKWNQLDTEINKTNKKIDEEVYKLYGLTQEEIAIVEGKNEKY